MSGSLLLLWVVVGVVAGGHGGSWHVSDVCGLTMSILGVPDITRLGYDVQV
jgi:hypothetical protein